MSAGLIIQRIGADGRRTEIDLRGLSIGDRLCRDMPQHELYRALRHLVPDVRVDDGHQALCEKLATYMAKAAADEVIERESKRAAARAKFDNIAADIERA
jgi:hypothetical protein